MKLPTVFAEFANRPGAPKLAMDFDVVFEPFPVRFRQPLEVTVYPTKLLAELRYVKPGLRK
jgi:hypothetical protein